MTFGIGGSDRFKSYSSNSDAGGKMGVYIKRLKRDNKDKKEDDKKEENLLQMGDDQDDDNLVIEDFDDPDFM